jgi:endoglucanase
MKAGSFRTASMSAAALALASALALGGCAGKPVPVALPDEPEPPVPAAIDLARKMGNGINLGNTMEAYGRPKLGAKAAVADYETFWGQPVTTREIVASFKKAGFDSLRIPVAWTNAMSFEDGDYSIGRAYLDRVGEIVGYALDEGMYAIVNDHWDGGWWGMFGSANEATRARAMELYVAMWTQIADKFRDFPDTLILESANEELGNRLNDTDIAADSGALSEDERYAKVDAINQAFVDTVRASGGNNADRFLLVAGYDADIEKTCGARFAMPKDPAEDRLLVSVHYYEPSDYCVNTGVGHWGAKDEYARMNALFKKMTAFTKAGYGVVVGEYGVSLRKDGSLKDNTLDFLGNLLDNCDVYGYCPVLWDCGSFFKRSPIGAIGPEVAALYSGRSLAALAGKSEDEIGMAARMSLGSALAGAAERPSVAPDAAVAWIMYNSGDFGATYSVGDKYNPSSKSDGLVATDAPIVGAGTYTVALDFSGTAAGFAAGVGFSAIGVANGERLFPGYLIDIKEILVNGQPYRMVGLPYTTSDDALCTRSNLYNIWVTKLPEKIRAVLADGKSASACVLEKDLGKMKTISVTFEYRPE